MPLDPDACYRAVQTRDPRFDGRFFTGVRTTGIYCRPICPAATPLRRNVEFYLTAAGAAEAGLRPCLRCRPETAPHAGAWRGASNTVNRALVLIDQGALDEGRGLAALAERLGVGERHLRRLFHTHLGASPIAVAQTRRVHLAKQLLHETRLSMAEIALASGYGSVRRFNEAFQALFGRAPNALRRQSAVPASEGPRDAVTVTLRYRPPYDWPAMRACLAERAIPGAERVEDDAYARVVEHGGAVGVIRVRPAPLEPALIAELRVSQLAAVPGLVARIRRMFDLAADPQAIDDHLAQDPLLAPLVAARPGLRSPGGWDSFERAVRAILGRGVAPGGAADRLRRLVEAFGAPAPLVDGRDRRLTCAFPRPERIVGQDLMALGLPQEQARALGALAEALCADPDLLDLGCSLDAVAARLATLPGLDEASARHVALKASGEPDAFPLLDDGLMRTGVLRDAGLEASQLLARSQAWRPWRAYAAQHLWG